MANNIKKLLIPLSIVVVTTVILVFIYTNKPTSQRGAPPAIATITVTAKTLEAKPYTATVSSYGTVRPRTQTVLSAQVSGQVMDISDNFREGGFFEKGDVLVQLDDRDHRAQLKSAQAELMSAQQALLEEQARVEQALIDWQRLGNGEEANSLVLRKPQLAAAQATVMSAQAQVDKAELDLERTKVVAPFAGRVLSQLVDIGQVVSSSTELGEVYASDSIEVRLPIKNSDLALIQLPERYRDGQQDKGASVRFSSDLFGTQQWQGTLIRTESAIDSEAQQLYVVGQISDPYAAGDKEQMPIKIGQYVKAEIKGREVSSAIVIPNSAIYQGTYVYTVKDGVLFKKDIEVMWQNSDSSIIKSGLEAGDKLVLTPLGQVSSGTPVTVQGEQALQPKARQVAPTEEGSMPPKGERRRGPRAQGE